MTGCVGACVSLGGEAGPAQADAVAPLPVPLALPVADAVLLVHHLLQQRLVVGVERGHADVTHRAELTAVVQVLVLQPEEVPYEPPAAREPVI